MSSVREIFERNCRNIPVFHCQEGCGECCGVHYWSTMEWKIITAFLKEHGRKQKFARETLDMCPYLDEEKKCTIYEVRPAICRLYGVVREMKCPHREPETYLSNDKATSILRACGVLNSKQIYPIIRVAEEVSSGGVIPKNRRKIGVLPGVLQK